MNRTRKLLTLACALLIVAALVYGYIFLGMAASNKIQSADPEKADLMRTIQRGPRTAAPPASKILPETPQAK